VKFGPSAHWAIVFFGTFSYSNSYVSVLYQFCISFARKANGLHLGRFFTNSTDHPGSVTRLGEISPMGRNFLAIAQNSP
jgi:hypothetical protein